MIYNFSRVVQRSWLDYFTEIIDEEMRHRSAIQEPASFGVFATDYSTEFPRRVMIPQYDEFPEETEDHIVIAHRQQLMCRGRYRVGGVMIRNKIFGVVNEIEQERVIFSKGENNRDKLGKDGKTLFTVEIDYYLKRPVPFGETTKGFYQFWLDGDYNGGWREIEGGWIKKSENMDFQFRNPAIQHVAKIYREEKLS